MGNYEDETWKKFLRVIFEGRYKIFEGRYKTRVVLIIKRGSIQNLKLRCAKFEMEGLGWV